MSTDDVIESSTNRYPPVDLFTEELVKEPRWYTLGMFLGVPTRDLDAINFNHSLEGIMRCLIEMHKYLHSTGKPLSWEKIASSLSKMDNCYLARCIRNKYCQTSEQKVSPVSTAKPSTPDRQRQRSSASDSASMNQKDDSTHSSVFRENNKETVIDVPEEVKKDFLNLTRLFSALVTEIECAFRRSKIPIQDLQRFIEEECELAPLSGVEATIENVFSRARQHYSLLGYNLLEFLVQTFLSENEPLQKKMSVYSETVNRFKNSAKLIDLMCLVEKQVKTDRHKIVKLKLREFWAKITVKKFEKLVIEIFDVLYNRVSQISVGRGCICVSWVIPDMADPLSLIPPQPQAFIKAIGIVSLHIGDSVVYDIPGEGCEVMKAAMLQAIELKSTRAIELLQAIGCDHEVEKDNLLHRRSGSSSKLRNPLSFVMYPFKKWRRKQQNNGEMDTVHTDSVTKYSEKLEDVKSETCSVFDGSQQASLSSYESKQPFDKLQPLKSERQTHEFDIGSTNTQSTERRHLGSQQRTLWSSGYGSLSDSSSTCPSAQQFGHKSLPRYGIPDHHWMNKPHQQKESLPYPPALTLPDISVITPTPTMEHQTKLFVYTEDTEDLSPIESEPFGHLKLKPLPRYGIPDNYWMNELHQKQRSLPLSLPVSLPGINVITPTPTIEDQVKLPMDTEELSSTVTDDDSENVKYSPQLHLQELSLSEEDLPQTPLDYNTDQKKKNSFSVEKDTSLSSQFRSQTSEQLFDELKPLKSKQQTHEFDIGSTNTQSTERRQLGSQQRTLWSSGYGSLSDSSSTCPSAQQFGHKSLPRYGIPDHHWMNKPHQQKESLPYPPALTLPDISVITPTPTMEHQTKLFVYTEDTEDLSPTESEPFGHLKLKPLPRYGIPDNYWMNEPHQKQRSLPFSLPVSLPGINVITPTPTIEDQVKLPMDTEELSSTVTDDDSENVKYSPQLHLQELSLSQEDLPQTPLDYDKDQKKKNSFSVDTSLSSQFRSQTTL